MAKRKKLKNIQISNQELMPTTIGYLDSKQKGPFLLLFIFAVLFATLYYMPELTEYFSGKKVPMDNTPSNATYDDEGKIFIFNDETLITVNNIEFSKIKINNDKLSIFIANTKDNVADLNDYYLELYDKDDNLLERISLSSETLNKYGKRTFNFSIANPLETNKISVSIITNSTIPEIELKTVGDMQQLTCTNNIDTYIYYFNSNNLKKVIMESNRNMDEFSDELAYQNVLQEYRNLASDNPKEGISNKVEINKSGFKFTKEIDLSIVNINDIDDEMFYKLDEIAKNVAFNASLKKYKCY